MTVRTSVREGQTIPLDEHIRIYDCGHPGTRHLATLAPAVGEGRGRSDEAAVHYLGLERFDFRLVPAALGSKPLAKKSLVEPTTDSDKLSGAGR